MSGFDDLMRKQAEVAAIAARIAGETEAAKIQALTAMLQRESQELQGMARAFEDQHTNKGSGAAVTAEQQQVEAQTRATVERLLAQIEKASPAAAEAVAKLRADPNFLGGILAKK